MKTTIEINDDLFQRIKTLAHKRNSTLKSVIEVALRRFVSEQSNSTKKEFHLGKCSFKGEGIQSGLTEGDWADVRERAYQGRGG